MKTIPNVGQYARNSSDLGLGNDGALSVKISQDAPIPLDFELECVPGELVVLVGPSGAGKTSLLRAIAGLLPLSTGDVRIGNTHWFSSDQSINLRPQKRSVGFVFQDYALFPHLSAEDNVAIAIDKTVPDKERKQRARDLLSLVNLEDLDARRPAALSGGQRQRVALARALARDPQVLLFDEPFSAVDQMTRERLKRELVALRQRLKIPMILVTHDLQDAMALADRIAVLYRGKLLDVGSPDRIRLQPNSRLVARLMGESNLFSGEIIRASQNAQHGALRFGDVTLDVVETGAWVEGDQVTWMVPSEHVVLQTPGRASEGAKENPVQGCITSMTRLGENTAVALELDAKAGAVLNLSLRNHTVARNSLAPGVRVTVSILAKGVHVMAADP